MATNTEVKQEGSLKWLFLPITLDLSVNPKETFTQSIMSHIKPEWSKDKLCILNVDGGQGCSNQLLGFYQLSTDIQCEGNVVLVRINGANSEQFTDRRKEIITMITLHQSGQGNPPIYFEFLNGLCFGYAPGRPVKDDDYKNEEILTSIMSSIAHFHTITLPDGYHDNSSIIPNLLEKLLTLIPVNYTEQKIKEKFIKIFTSLDFLRKETQDVIQLLHTFKSPLIYCHNDLQHGNIIYDTSKKRCILIDHEYGGVNYLGCELGDLFSEQAGLNMPDYSKYPNEDTQKNMIRIYLREAAKIKGQSTVPASEEEIHQLYVECNKGCLVMDFMWALWSLVQIKFKGCQEFDYLEYGISRYGHYRELRDKYMH